jgi:hypothetical protein
MQYNGENLLSPRPFSNSFGDTMADHQVEKAFQKQPTVFLAKKQRADQKVRSSNLYLKARRHFDYHVYSNCKLSVVGNEVLILSHHFFV